MKKIVAPFLRTPYNYDTNTAGDESGLECLDKSLAQQHQEEESNINNIVKRFTQTGELPQRTMPPMQGDFQDAPDFQAAMDLVVEARMAFMQHPADVRARFNNDPAQFVDFCSNEQNRDEMRKMGLWSPEAAASFAKQEANKADLIREGEAARAASKAAGAAKGDTQKGVT